MRIPNREIAESVIPGGRFQTIGPWVVSLSQLGSVSVFSSVEYSSVPSPLTVRMYAVAELSPRKSSPPVPIVISRFGTSVAIVRSLPSSAVVMADCWISGVRQPRHATRAVSGTSPSSTAHAPVARRPGAAGVSSGAAPVAACSPPTRRFYRTHGPPARPQATTSSDVRLPAVVATSISTPRYPRPPGPCVNSEEPAAYLPQLREVRTGASSPTGSQRGAVVGT